MHKLKVYSLKVVAVLLFFVTFHAGSAYASDIFVTTSLDGITDSSLCSLRQAVIAANSDQAVSGCDAGSGADTIFLQNSTTYTLIEAGTNENASLTGDLDITEALTIIGGSNATQKSTIRAGELDRVLHIIGPINVEFRNLNIEQGHAIFSDGGCVYNQGGVLILNAVSISECTADDNGGGLFNINDGIVALSDGTIHTNIASANGGGIYNESGRITLTDSVVFENQSSQDGGGVFNQENGTLILVGTFGTTVLSSSVSNNSSEKGGGIYNDGTLSLTQSEIRFNTTTNDGAGIYNTGIMTLHTSSVRGNTAIGSSANGGGIYNAHQGGEFDVWIQRSAISQNTVSETNSTNGDGGGIYNSQGSTIGLINSTISTNESLDQGGGIYNNGVVSMQYSTVKDNLAGDNDDSGGGLFNSARSVVNATLTATIMDNMDNCRITGNSTVTSLGYNIDSGNSCNFDTNLNDQLNTAPLLDIFQDNGGPTNTHALLEGSPAIDPTGNTVCPQKDQRGALRSTHLFSPAFLGTCDIGAYEHRGIFLTVAPSGSIPGVDFSGSAKDESEELDKTEFAIDNTIEVNTTFTVLSEDVGKSGHIAIVIDYSGSFYQKDSDDVWQSWDGDLDKLMPNNTKILAGEETLNIVSGLVGIPGIFTVYVVYVNESGQFIYSENPIEFTVSD